MPNSTTRGTAVALGMPALRSGSGRQGRGVAPGRPADPRLVDRFGRVATDLRVSLTDRCNLRCHYCMPPEGLPWTPDERLLDDEELVRLVRVAVERLGVTEVRFTGGEPLLRKGLERVIAGTTALRTATGEAPSVSLTTNGLGLAHRARALAEAGLTRVNVSLDTLDPERFARITRRDRHRDVLAGIAAAKAVGLAPVKVNAVLLRGVNDDEAAPLLRWALTEGLHLRFIEQMPLDPHGAWDRAQMVTAEEVLAALQAEFDLTPVGVEHRGSAPAETWFVDGGGPDGTWTVGVIGSVTRPFCGACDRTRLTADGAVRDCLFSDDETDLRGLLRSGATDEEVADAWRVAMWGKRAGHGTDDEGFLVPSRPMSAIGG